MLPFLRKLSKDATAVRTVCMTHLDDLSLYLSSELSVLSVIQAIDTFFKNNHIPARLLEKFS